MLNIQKTYIDYIATTKKELQSLKISNDEIDYLATALEDTELLIPVVGAFSSGKSSLINSLIGRELLPVDIPPETALATELHYSVNERIEAVQENNSIDEYAIDDTDSVLENADKYKYMKMYINNNTIKELYPLVIVDMPGFDSPLDLHNKAILNYIDKGVHFVILTSIEDGIVTGSIIREISNLIEFGRDYSFFLSKVNLRSDQEVEIVTDKIRTELKQNFEFSGKIHLTDDNGGRILNSVLAAIDPENLFVRVFEETLKDSFHSVIDTLNTSISSLGKSKDQNEDDILELQGGIASLEKKRSKLIADARTKYSSSSIDRIINAVSSELSNSVDEMTQIALNVGQDALKQHVSETVRHTLITTIRGMMSEISSEVIDEFSSELRTLRTEIPAISMDDSRIDDFSLSAKRVFDKASSGLGQIANSRSKNSSGGKVYKTITTVLSVTTTVIAPVLEIVLIFLPDIIKLFFGGSRKKQQEQRTREHIMTVIIPSVKMKLRTGILEVFNNQLDELITDIGNSFEAPLQEKQKAIREIEEEYRGKVSDIVKEQGIFVNIRDSISQRANKAIFV